MIPPTLVGTVSSEAARAASGMVRALSSEGVVTGRQGTGGHVERLRHATGRALEFLGDRAYRLPGDAHVAIDAAFRHVDYLSVFLFMALESTFLPIAAEIGLFPAGMESAAGRLWWPAVLAAAVAGSLAGSGFNYLLGHLVPVAAVRRMLLWSRVRPDTLARVESALVDNAGPMLFFGRFIPGVRHVVALVAGTWRVPLRRFFVATAAGDLCYVPAYFFAGYLSGGRPGWWTLAALGVASAGMAAAGILAARRALKPSRPGG